MHKRQRSVSPNPTPPANTNGQAHVAPAAATGAPIALLHLDPGTLAPLIRQVVEATVTRLEEARAQLPERLAFSEEEAAALLGLAGHVLRDERLRRRIRASSIVGRRVRYLRQDLIDYMLGRRVPEA
jgi:hypothetical protein